MSVHKECGGKRDLKVDPVCNHQVVEKCMTYEELRRSAGTGDDWVDASREEATWKTKSKKLGLCIQSSGWQL